ncbi:MAG: acetylglutamate kinase [Deltaproteobacteria bacterium]|nr:acetylglutamate kinase [Deltaproteobacteria bacterium]
MQDTAKKNAPKPHTGGDSGKLTTQTARKALLIEALSYIGKYKGKVVVIKYGGAVQNDEALKQSFAQDVVLLHSLGMCPVVVHGGGPEVSRTMEALGQTAEFVEGLRVTTREGLAVTEMVLSGLINKELVSLINAAGGSGIGISGKDGHLLTAQRMVHRSGAELGFVGEIVAVNPGILRLLLDNGHIPVISPLSQGKGGVTFNINADSAAARVASALKAEKIVFMTDVDGVLHENKLVSSITASGALKLISDGVIKGGMVPKVEAMLHCLHAGVGSAQIINGSEEHALITELFTDEGIGTKITP